MINNFIAYCKSPMDKKWYLYNDAIVTQYINVENEIKSNGIPYFLYYQKYQYYSPKIIFNKNQNKSKKSKKKIFC